MTWTPESLAQRLHEAYGRVTPQFYGYKGQAPEWESIPEKSREHMIAVCADVLGVEVEAQPVVEAVGEPVPEREVFRKARLDVPQEAEHENVLSDWEADLRQQIDRAVERAPHARKGFDGVVR